MNLIEQLRDLFLDDDIKLLSQELQAVDPNKFRLIIKSMIGEKDVSIDNYMKKYKKLTTTDKSNYIECSFQLVSQMSLRTQKTNVLSVEEIIFFTMKLDEYDKHIYGINLDDFISFDEAMETLEEDNDTTTEQIIIEALEKSSNRSRYHAQIFSEYDKFIIQDLFEAYKNNKESTCLFSVFEFLLSNPDAAKFVPFDHLIKLGVEDILLNDNEDEDVEIQKIIAYLQTLPTYYLSFSHYVNYKKKYEVEDALEFYKDDIDGQILQYKNFDNIYRA